MSIDARSRIRGALLGSFVGDALGAPFEGASPGPELDRQIEARTHAPKQLGYTDDTEMMIGLAESLVACGGFDAAHFMRQLRGNYEPARGYGRGMKLAFRAMDAGKPIDELAQAAWEDGSQGNGAAARVAPLACYRWRDARQLASEAEASATLTHAHPLGRAGCVVQAVAIGWLLCREKAEFEPRAFLDALTVQVGPQASIMKNALEGLLGADIGKVNPQLRPSGVLAIESVPLALGAFLHHVGDFRSAIREALRLGGDTDTTAAMTGALAGALNGVEAIPPEWLARLEDGHRGRSHVEALADQLAAVE